VARNAVPLRARAPRAAPRASDARAASTPSFVATLQAGLKDALMAPGPYTVFAPNDDAFVEVIKALKTTKLGLMELANLGDILKGHVVAGALTSDQLTEGQELTTLSGQKLKVSLAGGASVNGVKAR
jgi:uncharacterized surface protein with fasciclin (FAS1) repeats